MSPVHSLAGVVANLTSGDDEQAEAAAEALAQEGLAAIPALLQLLRSPIEDRRWWAVRAIAEIDHANARTLLVQALHDPASAVRQCAAIGLREHADEEALPALLEALGSADRMLARLASDALAAMGSLAFEALIEALPSPNAEVRIGVARALARSGDGRTIPVLYAALDDSSALVRHYAEGALERLGLDDVYFQPM